MLSERDLIRFKKYVEEDLFEKHRKKIRQDIGLKPGPSFLTYSSVKVHLFKLPNHKTNFVFKGVIHDFINVFILLCIFLNKTAFIFLF